MPRKPVHDDAQASHVPGGLFARARTTDPDTSHDAADAANASGLTGRHTAAITASLALLGPQTSKEIGSDTGLGQVPVARRMRELVDAGVVEDSGERRERSIVWRLVK